MYVHVHVHVHVHVRPANFVVVEAICYAKTEYSSARVSGGHNMSQSLRPICKLLMARAYSIHRYSVEEGLASSRVVSSVVQEFLPLK